MPNPFAIFDPRRWIRHSRNLQGFLSLWPQGGSDPGSPRLVAPWISDVVQLTTQVPPLFRALIPADPAVSASFRILNDQRETWLLKSLMMDFTTDANVADRITRVFIEDGSGNTLLISEPLLEQTASLLRRYTVSAFGSLPASRPAGSNDRGILLPPDLWLPSGFTIGVVTPQQQAGDAYTNIRLYFEVWPG